MERTTVTAYLGIDVSKAKLDACLLVIPATPVDDWSAANAKLKHVVVSNDEEGFQALLQWLSQNKIEKAGDLHACMHSRSRELEATAHYSNAIARFLVEYGCIVSVVNPAAVRAFSVTYL